MGAKRLLIRLHDCRNSPQRFELVGVLKKLDLLWFQVTVAQHVLLAGAKVLFVNSRISSRCSSLSNKTSSSVQFCYTQQRWLTIQYHPSVFIVILSNFASNISSDYVSIQLVVLR